MPVCVRFRSLIFVGGNGVLWDGMVYCGMEWCVVGRNGVLVLGLFMTVILFGCFLGLTSTFVCVTDCSS